jgi:tRNA threonylcarbamoyladenosine biosynthesis protein TsaE
VRQSEPTKLRIEGAEAMRAFGLALGRWLLGDATSARIIGIRGELGAGKTTLVSGILNAAGVTGPVRSPTYTLIEPYETPSRRIFHLDLYRLADPTEVEGLGIRDLLTPDSLLLIEWPERGAGVLPAADLDISIRYSAVEASASRDITLSAHGPHGQLLAKQVATLQRS